MEIVYLICNSIPVAITLLIWFVQACMGWKVYSRHLIQALVITIFCYATSAVFVWGNKEIMTVEKYKVLFEVGVGLQFVFAFFMYLFVVGSKLDYEKQVDKYDKLNQQYKDLYEKHCA